MHCQKKVRGGRSGRCPADRRVNDNQPTLLQRAEQACQTTAAVDQNATWDTKRRSRDETRVVEVFDPYAALADTEWAAAPSSACPTPPTSGRPPPAFGRHPGKSHISSVSSCCPPPSALKRSAMLRRSKTGRTTSAMAGCQSHSLQSRHLRTHAIFSGQYSALQQL
jgi:hypothetical protein